MDGPIGPTPGGMQAPQGMTLQQFLEWLRFQGAGGYGMGPYGYPMAYGISPGGQQNMMLNEQWGIPRYAREQYSPTGSPARLRFR